jgi:hypothetical protein
MPNNLTRDARHQAAPKHSVPRTHRKSSRRASPMAPVTESVLKQAKGRYLERPIGRRLSFRATRFANALPVCFQSLTILTERPAWARRISRRNQPRFSIYRVLNHHTEA